MNVFFYKKYLVKWRFLVISFGSIFRSVLCGCPFAVEMLILKRKINLNSNVPILLAIMRIIITAANVDNFFLNMADQSYLVKSVLIMHHECSQADIAHNSAIAPITNNVLEQISAFKQTLGTYIQNVHNRWSMRLAIK